MLKSIMSVALGLTVAAGATAQTDLAEDSRLVRHITLEDLEAIIVAEGHELQASGTVGDVSVRGATPEGLKYLLIGTACDDYAGTCLGINMQVRYTYEEPQDWTALANANLRRAATTTWRDGNTIGVTRYVILDGGQTMENIKINLQNLLAIAPTAYAFAKGEDPS